MRQYVMGGIAAIGAMAVGTILIYLAYSGKAAEVWSALNGAGQTVAEESGIAPPPGTAPITEPPDDGAQTCAEGSVLVTADYGPDRGKTACYAPGDTNLDPTCRPPFYVGKRSDGEIVCIKEGAGTPPVTQSGGEGPRRRAYSYVNDAGRLCTGKRGGCFTWM